MRDLIRSGIATSVHDLSDGGLAVALAEMAMASLIGAELTEVRDADRAAQWFGEDQGRYLVTVAGDASPLLTDAKKAGVPAQAIGTTGGHALKLGPAHAISVEALRTAHEAWFPAFMGN